MFQNKPIELRQPVFLFQDSAPRFARFTHSRRCFSMHADRRERLLDGVPKEAIAGVYTTRNSPGAWSSIPGNEQSFSTAAAVSVSIPSLPGAWYPPKKTTDFVRVPIPFEFHRIRFWFSVVKKKFFYVNLPHYFAPLQKQLWPLSGLLLKIVLCCEYCFI